MCVNRSIGSEGIWSKPINECNNEKNRDTISIGGRSRFYNPLLPRICLHPSMEGKEPAICSIHLKWSLHIRSTKLTKKSQKSSRTLQKNNQTMNILLLNNRKTMTTIQWNFLLKSLWTNHATVMTITQKVPRKIRLSIVWRITHYPHDRLL